MTNTLKPQMGNWLLIIAAFALFCLFAFGLSGCGTKHKIRKAQAVAMEYPSEFSGFCAKAFPVIPTYIKGKDSIINREVVLKGDSIPCPPNEIGRTVYVKCPDQKVLYRDIWRTDTIVKESTARLDSLNRILTSTMAELRDCKQSDSKHTKQAQTRLFYVISLLILFIGSVFLLFKKW